ncbi:MAG: amino acid permease, partial [Phaeodactylibacter sp.]|nr:amino acid permease [Phaeodactylibacter sp.]
ANREPNNHIETELSRDLGLPSALAIGIGTMIAAGIFTLSGLAIRNVGSAAIASFLLAAFVALFTALTYCEFVSIYPRTGEGYLYARKTFNPPLAYFVGWALFLGYTSSCAFYIASLSSYFNEFILHSPIESLFGVVMLAGLTLLNIRGTKESGKFQIIVTAAKVVLLIWFIFGGLSFVNMEVVMDRFSTDLVAIGTTSAMVFITFFGFSAIAASAGEVIDPVKNIPRAIFISMGGVTVLYTAVVLVLLFAGLSEYTEASMGEAAQKFLGPVGGYVIIGGAIFSMISASNASVMAGSRVMLSMSQLGHMPEGFGLINPRTRTPVIAVILVGGMILIFALILPLEDLSYFANTVLLMALIAVNAALIVHRRKFPDMERPFKVPFVPLLPALGILANIYLLSQIFQHIIPLLLALAAQFFGMFAFIAWRGWQPAEEAIAGLASHVAVSEGRSTPQKRRFRILAPIANPQTMRRLIRLAGAIAREKNGEIILLRVLTVPEQLPPTQFDEAKLEEERMVLREARKICDELNIPSHGVIRVGHKVARAILETSTDWHCDLTVLGWKGHSRSGERILGNITDAIVKYADTDIMLVKFVGDAPINHILLPTAGGEHAQWAEQYCATIARAAEGSVTVCRVVPTEDTRTDAEIHKERLKPAVERIFEQGGFTIKSKIIRNDSIADGIIEAADAYDAIMVGATRQSIYPQILFGNIPEKIAMGANKTVIMVKHHDPVKALLGKVVGE